MRTHLRKAIKSGYERIAVVVGAWHGPALSDLNNYKVSTDKALLKGLPKIKVKAAWVPWSFPRLGRQSGYGAGVVSPAWYELLFTQPQAATEHWMVAAARLLRDEGFSASPAMATDGVRLAKSLAQLRNLAFAGIAELDEAVLATLAAGRKERLALIHSRLIVGTKVGRVPAGITTVPLWKDLLKELKGTRLNKLWEVAGAHYLKATKTNPRGGIDLRTPSDLRKSHLLHRLELLDIQWGKMQPLSANAVSSFREIWLLEWQPEFSLLVTERSSYGNTLAIAAGNYAVERSSKLRAVDELADLVLSALRANLPQTVPLLVGELRKRASHTVDVSALLSALPILVDTCRYGDSRKTDTTALLLLIEELVPRLAAGLPSAVSNIDAEQAEELLPKIAEANYALSRLTGSALLKIWHDGLSLLRNYPGVAPACNGLALRLLHDHQLVSDEETQNQFYFALSNQQGALAIAEWISGFLYGSSQLILNFPPLWNILQNWVANLAWDAFERVLPLLRRTVSDFNPRERQEIFRLVGAADDKSAPESISTKPVGLPPGEILKMTEQEQSRDLLEAIRGWIGN